MLFITIPNSNIKCSRIIKKLNIVLNSAPNYYLLHETKSDYNRAFLQARQEALDDPGEKLAFYASIYFIKEDTLRKSVYRAKNIKIRN
ncbi:uncharacterized protein RSE6_01957 [Rhynchosporium secalis]|uniref:Uncharacterized protein n=1 Tax=Rhynchosporium secalis TaxID=38038 RepID=A0A1E1LZ21_RHYSE|nr:uncharacterized protein RSE6_01957 [Rhynchosporium secalis]